MSSVDKVTGKDKNGKKVYSQYISMDNPGSVIACDASSSMLKSAITGNPAGLSLHPNNMNVLYLGGHVKSQPAKLGEQILLGNLKTLEKFNEFEMMIQ